MAWVTRYVNPDADPGGNGTTNALSGANCAYVSLNTAESNLPADITGLDVHEIVCETGGTADTTATTFSGTTTDATHYIYVHTSASHRHAGVWNDAKYRLTKSGATPLVLGDSFMRVFGLQFSVTAAAGGPSCVYCSSGVVTGGAIHFGGNIIKGVFSGSASGPSGLGVASASGNRSLYAFNNIVYDFANGANPFQGIQCVGGWTIYSYNNTVQNCYYGYRRNAGTFVAKNCIANDCTDGFYGDFDASSNYNASDIAADAPGANSRNGADGTITFSDEAGDNFHLGAGDTNAKDRGTNDPGSGLFSDDIDGVARSGTWDIGADEYVAAGGNIAGPLVNSIPLKSLLRALVATL